MSKPAGIVQKENESPSEFYERLCEAYRLYTPIDPEATGSHRSRSYGLPNCYQFVIYLTSIS